MNNKKISTMIRVDKELLKQIDEAAQKVSRSRSNFITHIAKEELERMGIQNAN